MGEVTGPGSVEDRESRRASRLRRILRHRWKLGILAVLPLAAVVIPNLWVVASAASRVYDEPSALPENDVGLVPGTIRKLRDGSINPHFRVRIEAAARLYRDGRVKHLLLSGDSANRGQDEPNDMRYALIAEGIPESAITLDKAGFRTLDSVVRANRVFGQSRLTVITDDFHLYRALFLCDAAGIDAVGFSAESVPFSASARSRVREWFARVRAVLDVYALGTEPRSLDERTEMDPDSNR